MSLGKESVVLIGTPLTDLRLRRAVAMDGGKSHECLCHDAQTPASYSSLCECYVCNHYRCCKLTAIPRFPNLATLSTL